MIVVLSQYGNEQFYAQMRLQKKLWQTTFVEIKGRNQWIKKHAKENLARYDSQEI